MKTKTTKPRPAPPEFQVTVRKRGASAQAAAPLSKPKKRDNIFSKSRDTREDRGTREGKTSQIPQTISRRR